MCWTSFYWPAPFQYCRVDRSDARLIADGNSVVLVDHDTQILSEADWIVEMGPQAGADGGYVIAQGTVPEIIQSAASQIGPFLSGKSRVSSGKKQNKDSVFENGMIRLSTSEIHTVKPLEVEIPKGRLTVVTGVSGSGKTTLVLESLVPGWKHPSPEDRCRSM